MEQEVTYPISENPEGYTSQRCPILYALELVGQKWKLPILWYLFTTSPTRYNELKRKLGTITNVMLTKSLKELEEAGLVARRQYNEIPPRVEYSLTHAGQKLMPALNELYKWGKEQMESKVN